MESEVITLDKVLEDTEHLDIDSMENLLDILSKRLIEMKRQEILKRSEEATKAFKHGEVKIGNLNDLMKDLND